MKSLIMYTVLLVLVLVLVVVVVVVPQVIVPGAAVMREGGVTDSSPVDTLYWMREAELKHGRIAQLAGGTQSYQLFEGEISPGRLRSMIIWR